MDSIEKLSQLLNNLPGIGPRQAKRLAYSLIMKPKEYADELVKAIAEVKADISNCSSCQRFVNKKSLMNGQCSICRDDTRDSSILMIVSRDIDQQSVEKSGLFRGKYFILGGTVPVLDKNPEESIRIKELEGMIRKSVDIKEVILAYNQNPEGENTAQTVERVLKGIFESKNIKVSRLGRGLSTGTELEYSDNETLRNALRNRG